MFKMPKFEIVIKYRKIKDGFIQSSLTAKKSDINWPHMAHQRSLISQVIFVRFSSGKAFINKYLDILVKKFSCDIYEPHCDILPTKLPAHLLFI